MESLWQRLWFYPRQVSRELQVTDLGRSRRAVMMVGLGVVAMWTAACASPPTPIPTASATPSASPTTIAPGVAVDPSLLTLPPYSVSTSNPPPPGTSVRQVVKDFVADNLIENAALERADPHLLMYAATGGLLSLDQTSIANDVADHVRVLRIDDAISSLVLGRETDPNNSGVQLALNVEGVETTTKRTAHSPAATATTDFHVVIWVLWSVSLGKYLRCDVSVL